MSTPADIHKPPASPRNCWDYSEQEMREMSPQEAANVISLRQQDNARKAREEAEAKEAAKAENRDANGH